jgi:glucosamine-6-phosphate deaminase
MARKDYSHIEHFPATQYSFFMKIIVASNGEIASRHAAHLVQEEINNKPNTVFLLPTGSTPLPLYDLLAERVRSGKLSFAHATSFNLDEYLGIDVNHPESYHSFMQKNFFDKVDFKKTNNFIPEANPKDTKEFCKQYEEAINKNGIDLAIIGIGRNGHIAFNEPGTSFDSITHVTDLTKSTIEANARFFKSDKAVPKQAITTGLKTIMGAKKIILLAFGEDKTGAIKATLEAPATEKTPASILQSHKNLVVLLDKSAASKLKKTRQEPPILSDVKLYSEFNLPKGKTIVVFSPHPDDAPICAGATISALSKNNTVHEIILTTGHRAVSGRSSSMNDRVTIREKEAKEESKILGTKIYFMRAHFYDSGDINEADLKKLRNLTQTIKPDIALVPQKDDTHPTHVLSRKIALSSLPHEIELWSYESPWALFGHRSFNSAFEFSEKLMKTKLEAIRKHKTQTDRTRFDTAAETISSFRRITIAEQFFSELGKKPIDTQPYLELFNITNW